MQPVKRAWSLPRQRFIIVLLLAIALYVLLPQFDTLRQSLAVLHNLRLIDIAGAMIALVITFPLAAATYHFLARKPLVFRRTLLVALANMFTNRLLPAGTGSIATFFVYLRKRKHSVDQATSVVAINNALGFIGHSYLLLILFVFNRRGFDGFTLPTIKRSIALIIAAAILGVVISAMCRASWRRRLIKFGRSLWRDLLFYRRYPLRILGAFSTSILLTICNALTLWFCVQAVHGQLGVLAALAVFSIGIIAGTATPTPGGLGGTEAGLLAGLIGYHVPTQMALATVVLFRLLSYWLTLILGAITYAYVERRGYLHRFEPAD